MNETDKVLLATDVSVKYGDFRALCNVSIGVPECQITAFIGPSGCGKSTMLRCFNRLNDLIPGFTLTGKISYRDVDINAPDVDPVELRRHVGMVFQKANPFPCSIYENVAFGARINGYSGNMDELVESCLTKAVLWQEVNDRLSTNALSLSGGQQQRLCIARALAVHPDVILLDEPCSALDPISTGEVEELLKVLKQEHTIVIVTHNLQQARRISQMTAFFDVDQQGSDRRRGLLREFGPTEKIFEAAEQRATREYISGRVG